MKSGLTGAEFVGYAFIGSPERRPRLWFIERDICTLLLAGDWPIGDSRRPIDNLDVGTWTAVDCLSGCDEKALDGVCLRYDHHGDPPWTAVWKLTDTTISHVTTFGRDDDVWRLGLWPD